jgi:hypothetical protein
MTSIDYIIGLPEKRLFFRWQMVKIAENSDHNIGPKSRFYICINQFR